jgi:hypothetical protein
MKKNGEEECMELAGEASGSAAPEFAVVSRFCHSRFAIRNSLPGIHQWN